MLVRELIEILQKMPQDAIVIHKMYSDYQDMKAESITLRQGVDRFGYGLIRHHEHLMDLDPKWWPKQLGDRPDPPVYLIAVEFPGN